MNIEDQSHFLTLFFPGFFMFYAYTTRRPRYQVSVYGTIDPLVYFPYSRFGFKIGIWFLIAPFPVHCFSITFNVTVNNFSVMLGRSHRFLGIYQYFGVLKKSCSRTLHSDGGVRTSPGVQGSITRPPRLQQRM